MKFVQIIENKRDKIFDTAFLNKDHQEIFNSIGNEFVKFLFRITVTSPAVFLIWFSAAQFSKERYVLEQYEYKTSTAIAINSYAKLLKDRFPDTKYDDQRYAQITELIGKIFKETEYFKQKTSLHLKMPFSKGEMKVTSEEQSASTDKDK